MKSVVMFLQSARLLHVGSCVLWCSSNSPRVLCTLFKEACPQPPLHRLGLSSPMARKRFPATCQVSYMSPQGARKAPAPQAKSRLASAGRKKKISGAPDGLHSASPPDSSSSSSSSVCVPFSFQEDPRNLPIKEQVGVWHTMYISMHTHTLCCMIEV